MDPSQSGSSSVVNWNWQTVTVAILSIASLSLTWSYYTATAASSSLTRHRKNAPSHSKRSSRRNVQRYSRSSTSYDEHTSLPSGSRGRPSWSSIGIPEGGEAITSTELALRSVEAMDAQDKASDESKNLLNLLYSIAEDQARKGRS